MTYFRRMLRLGLLGNPQGAIDAIAPVLTNPSASGTAATTATIGATTDSADGTLFGVVTTSANVPSTAQIIAGQDHTGSAAAGSGSTTVASPGAKTINVTGLSAQTTYYAYLVHRDAAGNVSNLVSSDAFATYYAAETLVMGTSPVAGSSAGAATYIVAGRPVWRDGQLTQFRCRSGASATLKLKHFRRSGKTFTMISEQSLSVASGLNTFTVAGATLTAIDVLAGDYFGVYSATGNFIQYTAVSAPSGTEYFSTGGDVTTTLDVTNTAIPTNTIRLEIEFTISVAAAAAVPAVGSLEYIGEPTPVTGDAALSTSSMYFEDVTFVRPVRLETLRVYAGADGLLLVVVLTPTPTGFSHRAFSLSVTSGDNTYSAGTHFPRDMVIPAGGMLGYWNFASSTIRQKNAGGVQRSLDGTLTPGCYPTTSLTAFAADAVVQPQIKAGYRYTGALSLSATRRDETFSSVIHVENIAVNWSIVSGKAENGTAGLGNWVYWRRGGDYPGKVTAYVTFAGATDKFALFRKPNLFSANSFGTVVTVNNNGDVLAIHDTWDGSSTLPAIRTSKTCGFSLTTGVEYKVEFDSSVAGVLSLTITQVDTPANTDTITFDCWSGAPPLSYAAGRGYGAPGFAGVTGTGQRVSRMVFEVPVADPKVMFFGDSITDGQGASTAANSYAGRVRAALTGNAALVAGVGGCSSSYTLTMSAIQARQFQPTHIVILVGTNDTVVATWKSNIDALVARLGMLSNASLWIGAVPPEAGDSNPEVEFNPYLRANYSSKVIAFDYALTTGETGLGADRIAGAFHDAEHPNDTGYLAMYNRLATDAPSIIV